MLLLRCWDQRNLRERINVAGTVCRITASGGSTNVVVAGGCVSDGQ